MPGLRIAVANQKGGTGKTTLALNLAAGLHRRGSTLVLDADPQASISQWAAMSDANGHLPTVQAVAQDDAPACIAQGTRGHHYVVIDCPPTLQTAMVGDVLNSVDVLLVPIQPSPVDLWASVDITAAVRNARRRNPGSRPSSC
jgi:chromosome partitioning protein